jgi:flagellar basal-body rod modification protein FlgD
MTSIQSLVQPTGASAPSAAQTAAAKAADPNSEDRFLKLLVAQLKNQDPLSPLDNAQVTSQMAQISTVNGIDKLNTTLQSLSGTMTSTQPLQAAGLVGHQVLVPGSTLTLAGGGAAAGFSLGQPVDQLTVTVRDSLGNALHTVNLGAQTAGMQTFAWDGMADNGQKAIDGSYSFEVNGLAAGKKVTAQTLSLGRVDAVRPGTGTDGVTLTLGGFGDAKLSDVQQIF